MTAVIYKSNVVNLTGGVTTDDGRTLYGLDAETYLKMKQKEDPNFRRQVVEWVETVIEEKLPSEDLHEALKNGIILCKMINKIRPNLIRRFNTSATLHALQEIENINYYLKACWALGVPSSDMFVPSDLHQKRGMQSVIQNISALSRITTKYPTVGGSQTAPPQITLPSGESSNNLSDNLRKVDSRPAKKWAPIVTSGVVRVTDLVDDTAHQAHSAPGSPSVSSNTLNVPAVSDEQMKALKAELDKLRAEYSETRRQLQKENNEKIELQIAIDENKLGFSKEMKDKELFIKELEKQKSSLDTVVNESVAREMKLEKEILTLKNQLALQTSQLQKQMNEQDSGYSQQLSVMKSKQEDLQQQIDEKELQLEKIKKQLKEQQEKYEREISAKEKQLREQHEQFQREKQNQTENVSIQTVVTVDTAAVEKVEREKSEIQNQLERELTKRERLEKEMEDQADELQGKIKQLERKMEEMERERIKKLQQEEEYLAQQEAEFNRSLMQQMDEILELKRQLREQSIKEQQDKQQTELLMDQLETLRGNTKVVEEKDLELVKAQNEIAKLKDELKQISVKMNLDSAYEQIKEVETKRRSGSYRKSKTLEPIPETAFAAPEPKRKSEFYIERGDVDSDQVSFFREVVFSILGNATKIDFRDIDKVKPLFQMDSGRRLFSYFLKQALKTTKQLTLNDTCFEFLLYLINVCLNEMNLNNGADYISAKILLEKTSFITREVKGSHPDYLQDFIKEHHIWSNLNFWEEYFWDTMAKDAKRVFRSVEIDFSKNMSPKQQIFVVFHLQQMIDRMWGWGKLPVPSIQMFVANQAKQLCLDQNITDAILEKVEMYQDLEDKSKLDPNDHSHDPQSKGKKKGRGCVIS